MKIKDYFFVIGIFLLVLIFSLIFVFRSEFYSGDRAYFNFRYVNYVSENWRTLNYDHLSYGGRDIVQPPLFFFILALFKVIFGNIIFKILPLIFISSIVFFTYLLSKELTKNKLAILLSTLMSGFIPAVYVGTLNSISIYTFFLPVLLLTLYGFIKIYKNDKYIYIFVGLSFVLSLIHQDAFLIVGTFLFYFLLTTSESFNVTRIKKEAMVFSLFLIVLVEIFIFKKAFLEYSFRFIWQNIPTQILAEYFGNINLFNMVYELGILPIFFGVIGIVNGVYKYKNEAALVLSSLVFSNMVFMWLNIIKPIDGILLLGITLSVLSALGFEIVSNYIKRTKIAFLNKIYYFVIFILIVLFMIVPSYIFSIDVMKDVPSRNTIKGLEWIRDNTFEGTTVLATLEEGNLVTAISERKNVIDTVFLMAPDPEIRLRDVDLVYTSGKAKAIDTFRKYSVDYFIFTDKAKEKYEINKLKYIHEECLRLVGEFEDVEVYEIRAKCL